MSRGFVSGACLASQADLHLYLWDLMNLCGAVIEPSVHFPISSSPQPHRRTCRHKGSHSFFSHLLNQ